MNHLTGNTEKCRPIQTIGESSNQINSMTSGIVERLERIESAIKDSSPAVSRNSEGKITLSAVLSSAVNNCDQAHHLLGSIELALGLKQ